MLWVLGATVLIVLIAGIALQAAIARNGPAVLSTVDRIIGGDAGARLQATISTGKHPSQKLIVWGPAQRDPSDAALPVLLFAHGGSWRSGDPVDYGFLARAFVSKGFVVVLAGYRLHPDGVYPAMIEDTARAIAWAHDDIAQYGGDPDRIIIAGHSAGAYNVVMAALEQQWLGRKGLSPDDIAGVVGLSGPYDFYPFDSESTINAFGKATEPEATQPLAHIRGDAPPLLLIHGEKDDLVAVHNSRGLAKQIEAAGGAVETRYYPEMTHNDPLISLASPWRNRRDVDEQIAEFALSVSARSDTGRDQTSVPVQAEKR
ncbi:MAG: alpha/beta hydrolase [Pseudomonadota bacterium]